MRLTIFTKIVLVIFLLLVSTLLLYYLTNRSSVRLIKQEIQRVKLNELTFLAGDIDNNLSKISSFSDFLVLDKDVRLLATPSFLEGDFELNKLEAAGVGQTEPVARPEQLERRIHRDLRGGQLRFLLAVLAAYAERPVPGDTLPPILAI